MLAESSRASGSEPDPAGRHDRGARESRLRRRIAGSDDQASSDNREERDHLPVLDRTGRVEHAAAYIRSRGDLEVVAISFVEVGMEDSAVVAGLRRI